MTIQSWIAEARGRCEAVRLRGIELAHHRRCICVECEQKRTDLPRALEAIERLMQFVDHEDSLWGDPNNPAAQARADVERILTGAAGARVEKESDDE